MTDLLQQLAADAKEMADLSDPAGVRLTDSNAVHARLQAIHATAKTSQERIENAIKRGWGK